MLVSPVRRHAAAPSQGRGGDPEFTSVGGRYAKEPPGGDGHKAEFYVLFYPEMPRFVNVTDRRSNETSSVAVATCVVADRDGPVLLDLWRDCATSTLASFRDWAADTAGPLLIELKFFFVGHEKRKALTPMLKLRTSDRTEINRLAVGTRVSVTQMFLRPPSELLFTRDLTRLQQPPPYFVSISGVVGSPQDESMSQSGRPMRSFRIHDQTGKYVGCTALGRHVDNANIGEGREIVIYYANVSNPASANQPAQIWVYDECHIVLLSLNRSFPPPRAAIQPRG